LPSTDNKYAFANQLFQSLTDNGFLLRVKDYEDALFLLKESDDLESLKIELGSIVCTNPAQQEKFYRIFELELKKNPVKKKKSFNYIIWLIVVLVLVAAAILAICLWTGKRVSRHGVDLSAIRVEPIDDPDTLDRYTHRFDTTNFASLNAGIDKKVIKFKWLIDDSLAIDSAGFQYAFRDLKPHHARLQIVLPDGKIDTDYQLQSAPKLYYLFGVKDGEGRITARSRYELGDTLCFSFFTNDVYQDNARLYLSPSRVGNGATMGHATGQYQPLPDDSIIAAGKQTESTYFVPKAPGEYKFMAFVNTPYKAGDSDNYSFSRTMVLKVVPRQRLRIT
jgi:hypothetical protein